MANKIILVWNFALVDETHVTSVAVGIFLELIYHDKMLQTSIKILIHLGRMLYYNIRFFKIKLSYFIFRRKNKWCAKLAKNEAYNRYNLRRLKAESGMQVE